jgi:hypothetical protein
MLPAMAPCIAGTRTSARCRNNAFPGANYCCISSHGDKHKHIIPRSQNWIVNNCLGAAGLLVGLFFGIVALVGFLWYRQDRRQLATSGLRKPLSSAYPKSCPAIRKLARVRSKTPRSGRNRQGHKADHISGLPTPQGVASRSSWTWRRHPRSATATNGARVPGSARLSSRRKKQNVIISANRRWH